MTDVKIIHSNDTAHMFFATDIWGDPSWVSQDDTEDINQQNMRQDCARNNIPEEQLQNALRFAKHYSFFDAECTYLIWHRQDQAFYLRVEIYLDAQINPHTNTLDIEATKVLYAPLLANIAHRLPNFRIGFDAEDNAAHIYALVPLIQAPAQHALVVQTIVNNDTGFPPSAHEILQAHTRIAWDQDSDTISR